MGRANGDFFLDENSAKPLTNSNTFRDVVDINTSPIDRSLNLTATDSGPQIQSEQLEDDFTESFDYFSAFPLPSSPGYVTPAVPNQPGHGPFFHPLQYETPGQVGVVRETQDTVASLRSVSTP